MKKFLKIVQSLTKKEKFLTSLIQFNLQLGYSKIYNFLNLLTYGVINFNYKFSINIKIINIFIIQYNYLYIRISKINYLVFYYIIRLNNNILNKFKLSLFIIKYLIKKIFNNPLIFLKINSNKIFLKKKRTTLSKKKKNIFKWDWVLFLIKLILILTVLIFSELYFNLIFQILIYSAHGILNFFTSVVNWLTNQYLSLNPLIYTILEFPEFFKSFLESRILLKKILEHAELWDSLISVLTLVRSFLIYWLGVFAVYTNYAVWVFSFSWNLGCVNPIEVAQIDSHLTGISFLRSQPIFWVLWSHIFSLINTNWDSYYQISVFALLTCKLVIMNISAGLVPPLLVFSSFSLTLNFLDFYASAGLVLGTTWNLPNFDCSSSLLRCFFILCADFILPVLASVARFLYFSSNLASDLIGFQVFLVTLNYLHCFLSTKFFALLGDVGFALLAYTNIAAAPIIILSYTMAPGGAFYYFIAQAYGVVSVVPYAFIAQLYWLTSMFAVYAGYFSLVGVFAFFTSPHILFALAELVLFILNFAFDLVNLFTFAAVNSLIVFSENQITPFLGIVSWVSGNLASTLPNAFYVYYLVAMLLFSSGFVIVNRFLVDRIKCAQIKLNPLADSKQVVAAITHFSGASSVFVGTAGRLVTNLINLKPYYYNFPERRFSSWLTYRTRLLCNWAFTWRLEPIRQGFRANSATIKLPEAAGLRLLLAALNCFTQKITFLRWFVAYYFMFVNTLMQFFRGGLRYAYREPHQHRPENFNGSSVINYNSYFSSQHFYLITTLPLFFASYLSEFFFWTSGGSTLRFQQFGGVSNTLNLNLVTFNSRFLRELGPSSLKFSDENFSASELASKYFFFIDSRRPLFDSEGWETDSFLPFTSLVANRISGFNDLELQFLKHATFNAIFAEHYYDYASYYPGIFDTRYFNYAFTLVHNVCCYALGVSTIGPLKYITFPPFLLNWIFGYPYFQFYGNFFADGESGKGGVAFDVLATELNFLRFLVVNTFIDPTPLITIKPWRLSRDDWFTNPLFSWHWHYRRFNNWHSYFQRRSVRRLRGSLPRKMLYNLNPYKIFEHLPDFVVTSPIFNDDLVLGSHFYTYPSDLDKKLDGTHHQLVRTRTYNRYDFYRSPRRILQYPADRESGRYVTPEAGYYRATSLGLAPDGYLGNSYTLRRYNFFFSELSGFECKARALSGVGTWSFTFIPNDYFFKWFYYKYWTSKQAYYSKFLFYEKFQFLKRRKFYISPARFKHLWGWKRSVRLSHKSIWRFNNYKRERLTRRLATFFLLLRSDFGDFWREQPLRVKSWFSVTSRILSEQFFRLPFLSSLCEVILAVPLFTYFTALIHELLRLILRQIHSVFSFFLHTNIAPHYILPFEILKDILDRVFLGSTELRWGSEFSLYIFRSNVILYVKPAFYFDSAPFSGPNSNYFVDRY